MNGTRNLKTWLMICSFLLALVSTATGATLYVNTDGSGGAYTSIQAAIIDAAVSGDEIEVAPGTYYEAINFNGKAIRLYSSGGPTVTTIDASGLNSSVVTCKSGETVNTILEGFTITGGGGGIDTAGGGMYCQSSSPTVMNCTFSGNTAGAGGGILNFQSNPTVTDCTFSGNSAIEDGGAMYNFYCSSPMVTNCIFVNNTAGHGGGGMFNYQSNPTVSGCLFDGNVTIQGQLGTYAGGHGGRGGDGGGMYNDYSSPIVSCCQFIQNQTGSGGEGGLGAYGPAPGAGGPGGDGGRGAGMYNHFSSPTVTDCHFELNIAGAGGAGGDGGNNPLWPSGGPIRGSGGDGGDGGSGAGMFNVGGSPVVTNCSFSKNVTGIAGAGGDGLPDGSLGSPGLGAGLFNDNTSPTVTGCTFNGNTATADGGGMYNEGSSPTVLDCVFSANTAVNGGGMFNHYGSPTVSGCSFKQNWTAKGQDYAQPRSGLHGNHGGSGGDGAGMYNDNSSPIISGCDFIENYTGDGGKGQNGSDGGWWQSGGWGGNGGDGGLGAGIYNQYGSPTVSNCNFRSNVTGSGGDAGNGGNANGYCLGGDCHGGTGGIGGMGGAGAAMYNLNSSPVVTNCQFTYNGTGLGRNGGNGGDSEMYELGSLSDYGTNHTVGDGGDGGHGGFGAAIYNEYSFPAVTNCIFSGNVTTDGGEGGHQGERPWEIIPLIGKIYKNMPGSASRGGDGGHGAGICNVSSEANVANCTFIDNLTGNGAPGGYGGDEDVGTPCDYADCGTPGIRGLGAGTYSVNSSLTISNCILWGDKPSEIDNVNSTTTVTFSDVQGGQPGTGNISDCPMFVDPAQGDLRLTSCSPCVDAGNNTAIPLDTTDLDGDGDTVEPVPFDLAGNPRFMDDEGMPDTGSGVPPIVDMGAYERQLSTSTYPVRNVTKDASYCRIQMAIDDADNGDEIEVAPGTYYEAIDFNGKAVRLYSSGGPHVTTIDGTGYYHVVQCVSGEGPNTILEGFTVTGGNADGPTWPDDRCGGGMFNHNSSPTVTKCIFRGNGAREGGGMDNRNSSSTVTNCTFIANTAGYGGGGMNTEGSASPTITNCTFTGNTATSGAGGISNGMVPTAITNCIIWGNTQPDMTIFFVIPTVTYSNVRGGTDLPWFGAGCIDADPCFGDAEGRLSTGSPCIDAGSNSPISGVATDLDGNPRIMDGDFNGISVVDMGAYEHVGADADADGIEDSIDTAPSVYSNDFAQGSTSGTIVARGDQTVLVTDAPDPDGVRIEASASGGPAPAQVSVCGGAAFTLDAGDAVVATCGSIDIAVVQGTVEITFVAADGTQAETSLNAGNAIAFEPQTCTITAPASNPDSVVVIVNGGEIILAPGESKTLAQVDIDIYPNRTPNQVYLSRNYTLYVAILGSANFDVTTVNSSTVKFGRTGTEASPVRAPIMRDLNADGLTDAMYGFMTFDCGFQLGDTEGVLTGKTTAGIDVIGRDSVLVSP
jgi:hypothetical protein